MIGALPETVTMQERVTVIPPSGENLSSIVPLETGICGGIVHVALIFTTKKNKNM